MHRCELSIARALLVGCELWVMCLKLVHNSALLAQGCTASHPELCDVLIINKRLHWLAGAVVDGREHGIMVSTCAHATGA